MAPTTAARASRSSLSVEEFGRTLFRTGDLDPIYVMLRGALAHHTMDLEQAKRWCVAYWCYYSAHTASYVASAKNNNAFYERMYKADHRKMPRGSERRHWRGQLAHSTIVWMKFHHPNPLTLYSHALGGKTHFVKRVPFLNVRQRILNEWYGFGTWAAFKVTDMLSAVFDTPIEFKDSVPFWFNESLRGGLLVHTMGEYGCSAERALRELKEENYTTQLVPATQYVVPNLIDAFRKEPVPHAPDRNVEAQEIETVLCKYKSHVTGSYPLGKDTREVAHALKESNTLGRKLRRYLP